EDVFQSIQRSSNKRNKTYMRLIMNKSHLNTIIKEELINVLKEATVIGVRDDFFEMVDDWASDMIDGPNGAFLKLVRKHDLTPEETQMFANRLIEKLEYLSR
ncbi:MAG TPA: hypothetical protein DF712_01865, partial [Balneola sp.]|nr:hypothetical protein [Balneola sp.]